MAWFLLASKLHDISDPEGLQKAIATVFLNKPPEDRQTATETTWKNIPICCLRSIAIAISIAVTP